MPTHYNPCIWFIFVLLNIDSVIPLSKHDVERSQKIKINVYFCLFLDTEKQPIFILLNNLILHFYIVYGYRKNAS